MAGQDIILSVGIDLTSLRTAKEQINTELKSLVGELPIFKETKQFTEAQKLTRALNIEFSKLGTAIGQGKIDEYLGSIKKGATEATKASQAFKKDITDVNNVVSKTGATKFTDAFVPDAKEVEEATVGVSKLAQATAFYAKRTELLGPTISNVNSELNAYYRQVAAGIPLTETETARLAQLETQLVKMTAAQKAQASSLMHGIDLRRLLLWGVGWSAVYGAMRQVANFTGEVITNIRALNLSITEMRIVSGETADEFGEKWENLRRRIIESSRTSVAGIKELSSAAATFKFEGIPDEAIAASVEVVKDLMNITKASSNKDVVDALSQTYSVLGDKLVGVSTESEKMIKIGSLLKEMFTNGHIELGTYNTMMSRVGLSARNAFPNLETLVSFLQLMDAGFKGSRVGGMELSEILIALTGDNDKLADSFGILFKKGENSNALVVLSKLREEFGKVIDDTEAKKLKGAGFSARAIDAFKFVLENYESVNKQIEKNIKLTYENTAAQSAAIENANIFSSVVREIQYNIMQIPEAFNTLKTGIFADLKNGINALISPIKAVKEALDAIGGKRKKIFGEREEPIADPMKRLTASMVNEVVTRNEQGDIVAKVKSLDDITKQTTINIKELGVSGSNALNQIEKSAQKVSDVISGITKLPISIERQLAIAKQQANTEALSTLNANERVISASRVLEAQQKIAYLTTDEVRRAELMKILTETRGADELTIYNALAEFQINETVVAEYLLTLTKENYAVVNKMNQEIAEMASQLQDATATFASDLMAGTADINAFLDNIVGVYRQNFSQQLTQIFADTGIFTGMASAFMGPLQKAHYQVLEAGAPLIRQAHIDGISAGMAQAQGTQAAEGKATGGGGAGGVVGLISDMAGGGSFKTSVVGGLMASAGALFASTKKEKPLQLTEAFKAQQDKEGGTLSTTMDSVKKSTATTSKMSQAMNVGSQALGVAGGLYSAYSGIMSQKGQGAGQGAIGGALSGLQAGMMFGGPVGAGIGLVVGGILGGIMGGKKDAGPPPSVQSYRIESAIKLSNDHLQAISRNTSALNRGFEKWLSVSSQSSYFSESQGIESRFLRDRLMSPN